jgi:hypothetical protein
MRIIKPWPDNKADLREIEQATSILIGAQLTSVRYVSPQFSASLTGNSYKGFDIVPKGVELRSPGHVFVALWWMQDIREGLGFVSDPDGQFYDDEGLQVADIPRDGSWAPILDSVVISSALSWQVPNDEAPLCVWSLRLNVESGSSVTIALGDIDETGALTYQPDSVAVIFDETIARGYWIPASSESAWGTSAPTIV